MHGDGRVPGHAEAHVSPQIPAGTPGADSARQRRTLRRECRADFSIGRAVDRRNRGPSQAGRSWPRRAPFRLGYGVELARDSVARGCRFGARLQVRTQLQTACRQFRCASGIAHIYGRVATRSVGTDVRDRTDGVSVPTTRQEGTVAQPPRSAHRAHRAHLANITHVVQLQVVQLPKRHVLK